MLFQGSKVDITQADAVPKCDTVEVEKQIEVFLEFFWNLYPSMLILIFEGYGEVVPPSD